MMLPEESLTAIGSPSPTRETKTVPLGQKGTDVKRKAETCLTLPHSKACDASTASVPGEMVSTIPAVLAYRVLEVPLSE